jgi:glycosyltransferase involved in cell wall biosynthesis
MVTYVQESLQRYKCQPPGAPPLMAVSCLTTPVPRSCGRADRLFRVAIVTSIHPDFDARIWKHAKSLAARGHIVHLVCPWKVACETISGVQLHPFHRVASRTKRLLQIPVRLIRQLMPLLREVDFVHFHDIDILPWMSLLSAFMPVVYDIHENYAEEMRVRDWVPPHLRTPLAFAVRWGQIALAWPVRNVVLVAMAQESDFSNQRFRKFYLKNYASLEFSQGTEDNYCHRKDGVIFSGSQHVNNGSLLLLDIAERMLKRRPELPFYAVDRFASQQFRSRVLAEIDSRELHNVEILPNLKPHELITTLNRATIAISPNLRVPQQIHGVHTKLFEYMAAGLPVVASDLPHQVEVVGGNRAGLLASPEDPSSFVTAIERLLDDREYAAQLGRQGQSAFRSKYCWEGQIDALEDYYAEVLAR